MNKTDSVAPIVIDNIPIGERIVSMVLFKDKLVMATCTNVYIINEDYTFTPITSRGE